MTESIHRAPRLLEIFQIAVGLLDTITGLLLIAAPLQTLRLMRIEQVPESGVFVTFVGSFVLGVGLTYLAIGIRNRRGLGSSAEWAAQWRSTAIIRACVAVVLLIQIATGRMGMAWSSVVLTDGGLALLQWFGARRGWLRFGQPFEQQLEQQDSRRGTI